MINAIDELLDPERIIILSQKLHDPDFSFTLESIDLLQSEVILRKIELIFQSPPKASSSLLDIKATLAILLNKALSWKEGNREARIENFSAHTAFSVCCLSVLDAKSSDLPEFLKLFVTITEYPIELIVDRFAKTTTVLDAIFETASNQCNNKPLDHEILPSVLQIISQICDYDNLIGKYIDTPNHLSILVSLLQYITIQIKQDSPGWLEMECKVFSIFQKVCRVIPKFLLQNRNFIQLLLVIIETSKSNQELIHVLKFLSGIKCNNELSSIYPMIMKNSRETKDQTVLYHCLMAITSEISQSHQLTIKEVSGNYLDWLMLSLLNEKNSSDAVNLSILSLFNEITCVEKTITLRSNVTSYITILLGSCGIGTGFNRDSFLLPSNLKILYQALKSLVNVSCEDSLAQNICSEGGENLFQYLFELSSIADQPHIQQQALNLVRNLCIDILSCTSIRLVGVSRILSIMKSGKGELRTQCTQIIRNLMLQNRSCFWEFYLQPSTIPEMLYSLTFSNNVDLQSSSLDVLFHIVRVTGKKESLTKQLIQNGIVGATSAMVYKFPKLDLNILQRASNLLHDLITDDPWMVVEKGDWEKAGEIQKKKGKHSKKKKKK